MITRQRLLMLAAAAAAAAPAAACQTTESDSVLTRGMYAQISATADGSGETTVGATLFLGPPSDLNFIDLEGGDQLIAHHGGQAQTMSEQILLGVVSHTARFAADAADETFEVELRRDVDAGAPSSRVSLPAPFALDGVPASVSRGAAFGVSWTGAALAPGDRMQWTAEGTCVELASGAIAGDPGSVTMPAGTFVKRGGQNIADACAVKVTVTRERDGDVDPAYGEGGAALGVQTRSVTFTSTP